MKAFPPRGPFSRSISISGNEFFNTVNQPLFIGVVSEHVQAQQFHSLFQES
jgi:hypothetical protein